jgi:hypothetical protein
MSNADYAKPESSRYTLQNRGVQLNMSSVLKVIPSFCGGNYQKT